MTNKQTSYQFIYLTTPFCGVCATAKPIMQMLAKALEVEFMEMDANKNSSLLHELQLKQVPAVLIKATESGAILYQTDVIKDLSSMFEEISQKLVV